MVLFTVAISCLNRALLVVVPRTPLALINTPIPDEDVLPEIPAIAHEVCDVPIFMVAASPNTPTLPIKIFPEVVVISEPAL